MSALIAYDCHIRNPGVVSIKLCIIAYALHVNLSAAIPECLYAVYDVHHYNDVIMRVMASQITGN